MIGIGVPLLGTKKLTIFNADFTSLTKGDMSAATFLSSTGLTFARASGGSTIQTSASTLITGLTGSDRPRVGYYGLVIDRAATNNWPMAARLHATGANIAGASGGTIFAYFDAYGPGPDVGSAGAINADRFTNTPGGYASYYSGVGTHTYAVSAWVQQGVTATPYQILLYSGFQTVYGMLTPTWQKINVSGPNDGLFSPVDNRDWGNGSFTVDILMAWIQLELDELYTTECIYTTSGPVTRAGEQLSQSIGSKLIDSGQLSLEIKFVPKGGAAQYSADMYIYSDQSTTDSVWIDHTTQKLNAKIGGTPVTLGTVISWNPYDTVQMFITAGGSLPTTGYYAVNGGMPISLGSNAALGSLAPAGGVDLFCKSTGNQLTCSIQTIAAWKSGKTPAWI